MEWIEAVEEDLRMLDEVRMILNLNDIAKDCLSS